MDLTASVWTRNKKTAQWAAERLEAGGVTVNDHMITFNEPGAIWGGIKQTGMGRTHGPYGLLEIANIKFVSADFSGKKSRMWWYPYEGGEARDHGESDRHDAPSANPGPAQRLCPDS